MRSVAHAARVQRATALARPPARWASLALRDRLLAAGCTDAEAAGWSAEMEGWQEHSVAAFVEKLAKLKRPAPPPELPPLPIVQEVFVNPVTGEVGGPRGPEPTRYGDWGFKGRCTDF